MTVEEDCENFSVGLRVLAVDDDPICLKLLDTLLRKCQYHVTTTSQARMALKMLRENQNRFDLVISDVHMPDIDGFRLLELVGLEMDLPVIMLSANGDPKLVMKGVQHGACDYLVKPVRIEELRNIWQHVIRRKKKKTDPKDGNNQGSPLSGNTDHKYNRKRKEEEDECEDKENESDNNGTQKKARVVWSIELHRKFVRAVNQLGIEKAVPKRILDMMNVEGLTRENVASHLQKYRIYLKRISSQQANIAAALGVKDSPFMHMGPLDGFRDFQNVSGARISNVSLPPFASNCLLGHLNSPTNMSHLHNLSDVPSLIQPNSQPKNLNNTISLIQPNMQFTNVGTFSDHGPAIGSQMASFGSKSFSGTDVLGPLIDQSRLHQNYHNNIPFLSTDQGHNSLVAGYLQNDPIGPSSGMDLVSCEILNQNMDDNGNGKTRSSEDLFLDQPRFQGGFACQGYDPLDELMNAVIKREPDDAFPNCEYVLDHDDCANGQGVW